MNLIGTREAHNRHKRTALATFAIFLLIATTALVFHGHLHVYRHLKSMRNHFHLHAGAAHLRSPEQLAMSAIAVPERFEASAEEGSDVPTLQIGLNGNCLDSKLDGANFLVAVTARSILNEEGKSTPLYGKQYRFPRALLNGKQEITSVPVDLSALKNDRKNMDDVVVAVSICKDNQDSTNCDTAPISQPFRMAGHYLDATTPSGKLNIQFVSDPANDRCSKI